MFKKKECKRCGKKISDNYEFCPHCGFSINKDENDWGMLGKNDFTPSFNGFGFPGGLNTIFNSLIKTIDKQFEDFEKQPKDNKLQPKKTGIIINISTSPGRKPEIRVNNFGDKNKRTKPRIVLWLCVSLEKRMLILYQRGRRE